MENFDVLPNEYLKRNVKGYYHQLYTGFKNPHNPDFVNVLKNSFDYEDLKTLTNARNTVVQILVDDIAVIAEKNGWSEYLCVCVPRAKTMGKYSDRQLMFREAVKIATTKINGAIDGTDCITRIKNTRTTHIRNRIDNDPDPYRGITNDTCRIDKNTTTGANIILIDDVYTKRIGIDEDCIQALFDSGAKNIIFYAIGYTQRRD